MRKIITLLLLAVSTLAIGQAKKPTLMVVPSDAWCIQNGYSMNFENQGTVETIPDYKAAFQNDPDLLRILIINYLW